MRKYIYGLSAAAIIGGSVVPSVYGADTNNTPNSSVSVTDEGQIVIDEAPGLLQKTDIGELVLEQYIGGEQAQIIRYYEYNDEESMKSGTDYKLGYYEVFELPQSIVKKVDKLPENEQITTAKKILADYYNEAKNWSGLVSLLGINTTYQNFKDIWVDKDLKEQFLDGQEAAMNELKTNKTKDLSEADYKEIWSYVTDEQRVSNKLRTKEVILEKAEERYKAVQKDDRGQEKEKFIPIMMFSIISLLVGFTLIARR